MKKGQRRNVTKAMEGISNAFYQADAEDEVRNWDQYIEHA